MNSMMNASNAILVDTNILIYAYDPRDRDKQDRTRPMRPRWGTAGRDVAAFR